ncbi:MAG: cardiolipin synthase ClsB [Burkholderiales bacterium]|nr:cardiolipin synthase ClsB [Burkholderiales bacterium]
MRSVTFTADNNIALLHCGAEYFPALEEAFEAAKVEIYLETYIFAGDETGEQIKGALRRAAARGVVVNVIVDWHGSGNAQSKRLKQELQQAGVHCRIFNPWFMHGITRTHRKLCVVDRHVAFVGGLNINHDLHDDEDQSVLLPAPRWDFAVKIIGPLVATIHREVEAQWARMGRLNLRLRWELLRHVRLHAALDMGEPAMAGLVVRDNLRNRRTIQRAYLQALGHAKKSAWLANPYFAPGRKLRVALAAAAARGVDVTLVLGVGQFRLLDAVTRSYYPKLLKSGVRIVEYRKTQLHGKVGVIDDEWATVGSSNYDGFSLLINHEANVVVRDIAFAVALREHIERAMADGVPMQLEDFVNIPWYKRVFYETMYQIYKATMRIIAWRTYS